MWYHAHHAYTPVCVHFAPSDGVMLRPEVKPSDFALHRPWSYIISRLLSMQHLLPASLLLNW